MALEDRQVRRAIERAWGRLMSEDPRIPSVVIDLTPGRASSCTSVGWRDEARVLEMNLQAGGRNLSGREVMEWLMHQAAHAIAGPAVGQEGRAHGIAYRGAAEAIGLDVDKSPTGYGKTQLAAGSRTRYRNEIAALERALDSWVPSQQAHRSYRNPALAVCGCGRKIRVQQSTLEQAPIICGRCGGAFTLAPPSRS